MMMSLSAARRRISVMKQRSNSLHFWPSAGIGAGIELVPERAGFGQFGEFGAVSGGGGFFPGGNGAILFDLFEAAKDGLVGQVVELFAAEIILAAFHVADARVARLSPSVRLRPNRAFSREGTSLKKSCS